jgi:signal transduction histidine kinase
VEEKQHRLEVSLPAEPLWLEADPARLDQVLSNLLNNAAKYTPAGTRVSVSARKVEGTVEIRVTDDGPGIPATSIDRVFELFYRDPASSRLVAGSGIGLFVCASLVEAMGGRIWASRVPEGGTEIGFSLRIMEPDAYDADERDLLPRLPAIPPEPPVPEPSADRKPGVRDGSAIGEDQPAVLGPNPAPAFSEGSTPTG